MNPTTNKSRRLNGLPSEPQGPVLSKTCSVPVPNPPHPSPERASPRRQPPPAPARGQRSARRFFRVFSS